MTSKRAVVGLLVAMIAAAAMAQDVTSSEFGRVSAGEVELLPKQTRNLSGSLGFTLSKSKGYEATLGGTILQDRLWFFATAQQQDVRVNPNVSQIQMPERALARTIDTKLNGQVGDRQNFDASFDARTGVIPSSFLSLRYTGIVSSNMFFNATFSQRSMTQSGWSFAPGAQSQ